MKDQSPHVKALPGLRELVWIMLVQFGRQSRTASTSGR